MFYWALVMLILGLGLAIGRPWPCQRGLGLRGLKSRTGS